MEMWILDIDEKSRRRCYLMNFVTKLEINQKTEKFLEI